MRDFVQLFVGISRVMGVQHLQTSPITSLSGPQYQHSNSDERGLPVQSSDRDSPTLSRSAEDGEEPEERGDGSVTDGREEEDARSSSCTREDGSETGDTKSVKKI